ncbi:MAG: hypothetical protein KC729_19870, partial [Candidatus Eisenbacteria bacterium]|nr:hypothetical protein [Candidatus Eisenbacteria bacterium]
FNTNSFRRGSLARSIREFLRIVSTRPRALDAELAAPFRREPLFSLLSEHGFTVAGANDGQPTAEQVLGGAEDLDLLPAPVRHWLSRSFGLGTRVLRMRLDWIVVSRLDPQDARTHTAEVGASASDHALIHVDLERPGEPPAGPRL